MSLYQWRRAATNYDGAPGTPDCRGPHPLAPSPSLMERGKRCWRVSFSGCLRPDMAQLWRICAVFFYFSLTMNEREGLHLSAPSYSFYYAGSCYCCPKWLQSDFLVMPH